MTDFFGNDAITNLRVHLLPGLWPLLVAFAVCALAVPLMIRLSRSTGMIALPGGRHAHLKPTPLLGGVALYLGFAAAVLIFLPHFKDTAGVLIVSGLAAILLIADDRWQVRAAIKFGLQLVVVVIAILVFGFKITSIGLPGDNVINLGYLAIPITIFWLLGMQNTVNFLDGVDGLAAGVVLIVAVTLMLAAAGLRQPAAVELAGALAGTCGGFLLFNFYPAKIFMGDSGAHFLGAALAVIAILGVAKVAVAFALVVPVLALALPIGDTAWAIFRRRRDGTSVARPDLQHLHHRLQAFGLDARQTCYVFYAASALLGALGLTLFGHGRILAVVLVTSAALASTVAADLLLKAGWRVRVPYLRTLLG
ncbi:MAG: UDP-GlcNAc:undecaprenyl-phosphate/decaprenyl-phosphate GlcNAc-phosphate transferase [Chloroflexota bacterium]|jgi:UDP-GlcNAc:undecaprenyl-phosphate GlcNAc-1-phosphate transferase|nr:UDP-GlcNAc:undecaprenyl-phosphate/decaprenyl-phosphate GlcNAc-phosphate transferase [Chloroflexota bacterium]